MKELWIGCPIYQMGAMLAAAELFAAKIKEAKFDDRPSLPLVLIGGKKMIQALPKDHFS